MASAKRDPTLGLERCSTAEIQGQGTGDRSTLTSRSHSACLRTLYFYLQK